MDRRHLIVIGILFVIVAGAYFWRQSGTVQQSTGLYSTLVPAVDEAKVTAVTAWTGKEKGHEGLALEKRQGRWRVRRREGNHEFWAKAKEAKVSKLISALSGLQGDLRAESEEVFEQFHIADGEALHIVLQATDGPVAHLLVGKKGERWDTCYIRRAGSNKVYLVEKNILSLLDIWSQWPTSQPSPRPWTDLSVISGLPKDVVGISYERGDLSWSLSKSETRAGDEKAAVWRFSTGGHEEEKAADEVKKFLERLLPLQAVDVYPPDDAKGTGLGPGEIYGRLTIHFEQSGIGIYHIGNLDAKGERGWIRDQDGDIYVVKGGWIRLAEHPFEASKAPAPKAGDGNSTLSSGPGKD